MYINCMYSQRNKPVIFLFLINLSLYGDPIMVTSTKINICTLNVFRTLPTKGEKL